MSKKHVIDQESVLGLHTYISLLQDHKYFLPILLFLVHTWKYVSSLPEVEKITKIFLSVILSTTSHCTVKVES